ncbi:MAG TPA: non-homologous end-joining DNA ligase [Acidimicrobiia bacterium]
MASSSKTVIEVAATDGTPRRLTLTNLDKVLYPSVGFTKAAVVDYYARIAPFMLDHLRRRVVTMVRYPNGVDEESFFEKRCPPHAPEWVMTDELDGLEGCVVDDLPTLVWIANLAALELHTHQATVDDPDHPTAVVFDLDPGAPATILDCCRVALDLRAVLADLGLSVLVKTSGSKGLHLSVPITGATSDATKDFARACGQLLAKQDPDRITIVMNRDQRPGKVFVDWSQNDRHKTTVTPYSLRARPRPLVSAPISWDEVSSALDEQDESTLDLDAARVLDRVESVGDLFAPGAASAQRLPSFT